MKTPHKHAEVIKAWADGCAIEYNIGNDVWVEMHNPIWHANNKYRIKPEPKPDVVKYMGVENINGAKGAFIDGNYFTVSHWFNRLKLTFDGETNEIKAVEIIK